ncbi:long-chain-fatty-acid--CoA ligase [Dietzia sp. NCCP-2495]|uniref:class I adenylate-forming enzyme family protein n=1 Tax=Dietzia sp. NCCP-2495 TaxID=2934675 RepID=UPI0022325D00|nr:AMP-binding protein [Dietzia sp. NCCP-2495]GLB65540.1 long-chain-fatty-acid--CoA ligase [Dietzia sp. NCCP-2495]
MEFEYLPGPLAAKFGDAPAVGDDSVQLSFRELDARVQAVAQQFRDHGVSRGDIVAVMLPNRSELVLAIFAAWHLGAAATPINPNFTASEADHQISDAGAVLVVNAGPDAPDAGRPSIGVDDLRTSTGATVPAASLVGDDLALVIYTSGSTGRPKGVMLTHSNVDAMTSMMTQVMQMTAEDHCLLILPLFHANALMVSLLSPLRVGARLSIVGTFSASTFFDRVEQLRPTFFSAVPTIYALLLTQAEGRDPDMSSLRFAVCGAAPATRELLEAAENFLGAPIIEGYGLTEATCASAVNPIDGLRKPGTVGPVIPGQRIRIVNDTLEDVPTGSRGEVLVTGPTVMAGYLNNPEATGKTLVDGWVRTGDVGVLDDDGYLSIVDRIKDMIIRGGENLYPKEIESAIGSLSGVLEVAVVGRPDAVLGEVPVAYVVPYPEAELTPESVIAHCSQHLTRVKVPVDVEIISALPKNPVGKIDKPALRAAFTP